MLIFFSVSQPEGLEGGREGGRERGRERREIVGRERLITLCELQASTHMKIESLSTTQAASLNGSP